jgi:hypothetical protein
VEEKVYHYLKILVRRFLLPVLGLRDFLIELVLQRFVLYAHTASSKEFTPLMHSVVPNTRALLALR